MTDLQNETAFRPRSRLAVVSILGLLLIAGLLALGTWQVKRLFWKLDLIARVEQRIGAPPVPAPPRSDWPNVSPARDEYRHVALHGRFLNDEETLVYAATELGAGYWVMTPLALHDGTIVLVNRGFVPMERRDPKARQQGRIEDEVKVTGLMRMDEPKGSLLQSNRPREDRWYSRDVGAIAAARGLSPRCALLRRCRRVFHSWDASRRRADARRLSQQSPGLRVDLVLSRSHDGGNAGDFLALGAEIELRRGVMAAPEEGQFAELSVMDVPAAATLRPSWPVTLTVWRWTEPEVPPTSTFAPTPAPSVASAVAPL